MLTFLSKKINHFIRIWNDLSVQKNFHDLLCKLPFEFFSFFAKFLLFCLPLGLLVKNIFNWKYCFESIGLICAILELFYIAWFFINGNKIHKAYFKPNILPLCFVLLLCWSLVSASISGRFIGYVHHREGFFTYIAYAGVFSMTGLIRSEKSIRRILSFITLLGSSMCLWALLKNDIYKEIGLFSNQNHYGYFLCMTIPLALGLFISSENKYRSIYILEAILLTTGLIYCRSSGPFIATSISVICFIIFVAILHKKKIIEFLFEIILCIAVGTVSAVCSWDIGSDFMKVFSDFMILASKVTGSNLEISETDFNKIGSSRGVLWKQCIGFIKERPLFGFGPDGLYDQYYFINGEVNLPHNEFLQIAGTLGIPALGFYLTGLISLFIRFIKIFKKLSLLQLTLFVCVLSYLISSFFGCTMDYTYPFFMILLGFCFNLSKAPDSDSNTEVIK